MFDSPEYGLLEVIYPIVFFMYLSYLLIISVVLNGGGKD